jgi:hypothetical protein
VLESYPSRCRSACGESRQHSKCRCWQSSMTRFWFERGTKAPPNCAMCSADGTTGTQASRRTMCAGSPPRPDLAAAINRSPYDWWSACESCSRNAEMMGVHDRADLHSYADQDVSSSRLTGLAELRYGARPCRDVSATPPEGSGRRCYSVGNSDRSCAGHWPITASRLEPVERAEHRRGSPSAPRPACLTAAGTGGTWYQPDERQHSSPR